MKEYLCDFCGKVMLFKSDMLAIVCVNKDCDNWGKYIGVEALN
jgi:hypothetical protein